MGYNYWNGTEAAHRRVMMKAAGYSDEDILRNRISEYRILTWQVLPELRIFAR